MRKRTVFLKAARFCFIGQFAVSLPAYDKEQRIYGSKTGFAEAFPASLSTVRVPVLDAVHVIVPAVVRLFDNVVRVPLMETGRCHRLLLRRSHFNSYRKQTAPVSLQPQPQRKRPSYDSLAPYRIPGNRDRILHLYGLFQTGFRRDTAAAVQDTFMRCADTCHPLLHNLVLRPV